MFPYHLARASWNRGDLVVNYTGSGMITKDKDKDHGHQDRLTTTTNLRIKRLLKLMSYFLG